MLKQKTLRWIVILSILVAVSVPMINLGYVYPSFVDHTVSAVEKDAVRISKLLGRVILAENNWEDWISLGMIPDFIKNDIEKVVDDIELLKLKFFLADGKTIYSTDIDDVGKEMFTTIFIDRLPWEKPSSRWCAKSRSLWKDRPIGRMSLKSMSR